MLGLYDYDTEEILATFKCAYEAEQYSLDFNNAELDRYEAVAKRALEATDGMAGGQLSRWMLKTINGKLDADTVAAVRFVAESLVDQTERDRRTCGYDYGCRRFDLPRKKKSA